MKKLLLICAALLMMINAKAQFPMMGGGGNAAPKVTGRISATILDSLTKQPVEYATVSLINAKTSKTVNGALTDTKGKVSIQNIAPGEYKLVVGFIGYTSKNVMVKTTPEKPDNNIGNVYLTGTSNTLNQVTIEGKKNIVENKIDRMVYNAEADATNAGGDATDVMRKVPMLSVDINGNVQLRGSAVRVLINGKPSGTMANSVADALKMIPADQIKSVEVITNPSAKYEAEGSGGIINIITKKSNAEGVSGSVNASAGTRQNNGSFNLTAKSGRLSANTALGGSFAYPQETRTSFFNRTSAADILQNGMSDWKREGFNGSLGMDYDFNAYNNLSTNAKYNRFYNGGPSGSSLFKNNVADGTVVGRSDMGNNNLDWNLDYRRTTKKKGEEFSVAGQITQGRNTNEFINDQRGSSGVPDNYSESRNVGRNREYTLQTDYVYPFAKSVTVEVGAKAILRNIRSEFARNTDQDFDYDQNVGAAYSTISFNLTKKIQFKGGVRAEYTEIGFVDVKGAKVTNDYFNLFPSAILSQTIKGSTTVKLAYNKRVQRPSLAFLNPFLNETNPYNVLQGNPLLDPEISHNIELGYSTFVKGSMINASLFYRRVSNIIENFNREYVSPTTGLRGALTTYNNIGTTQSFGTNVFASYNPTPKWTLMTNIGLNTYEVENNDPNRIGMNQGTYLNYNFFMRSATAFKGGWNLELFGVVNSPRYTFQSTTAAMFFYGGGVKKDIMKKQGSVGFNVLNPFKRDLHIKTISESGSSFAQTQNIYYPLRQIGLNFSYKFGKLKFTEKKKIKNDDIKQDQQQGGGMGGMGQGR
jgi:outer membrane receptor for ferrienterochelin and colicin